MRTEVSKVLSPHPSVLKIMAQTQNKPQRIETEKLRLGGMDCADCAISIERSLQQMPGVVVAGVNFGTATAEVQYDPASVSHADVVRRIEDLGYHAEAAA